MAANRLETVPTYVDRPQVIQESFAQYINRMSMRLALPTGGIIALLVILLNLDRSSVPLSDDLRSFGSLAFFAMLPLSTVTAGWAYRLGVRGWNDRVGPERQRSWYFGFLPVALAYMLVTAGLLFVGITLIERAFRELQLSLIQGTLLAVLGSTAFTFWIVGDAMRLDTRRLLTLVVVILASGVYLTLVAIDDPQWWRVSFSYLGKLESNVNWLFNA
ncbi:MAG: hypothetical protein KDE53_33360, partial [Caldilineaceae bacterium]|nr:hypothetical protein [Caldilineaceae bacterium]